MRRLGKLELDLERRSRIGWTSNKKQKGREREGISDDDDDDDERKLRLSIEFLS